MPLPNDRCSFEVVYKRDAQGVEVIDHVVVRTGASDAAVSLTIAQVENLARLLNVAPPALDPTVGEYERGSSTVALPRAHVIRSE